MMSHVSLDQLARLLSTICIFFFLEILPTAMSTLNVYSPRNYGNSTRLGSFQSSRRSTRRYCTCGDALLQSRFCKQDFCKFPFKKHFNLSGVSSHQRALNKTHPIGKPHHADVTLTHHDSRTTFNNENPSCELTDEYHAQNDLRLFYSKGYHLGAIYDMSNI